MIRGNVLKHHYLRLLSFHLLLSYCFIILHFFYVYYFYFFMLQASSDIIPECFVSMFWFHSLNCKQNNEINIIKAAYNLMLYWLGC